MCYNIWTLRLILRMVSINLWIPDNKASTVCVLINDLKQIVRIKSMLDGLPGLLKLVGPFNKFFRW